LSIRRGEGDALVSQFMHANAKAGFRLHALMPRGKFVLDQSSERAVVLVSGGVGITPMMAITEHIVEEGRRSGKYRPIHFIHGGQNGRVRAFGNRLQELASEHPTLSVHVCFSSPSPEDKIGVDYDNKGRVDISLLTALLPPGDFDFYLCGPSEFMNSLYSGLTGTGVRPERIHYESFGPGTVLKPGRGPRRHGPAKMALCSSLRKRLGSLPLSAAARASAGHAKPGLSAARWTTWTNRWLTVAKGRSCCAAPCRERLRAETKMEKVRK
jgi:ferredoxin-NADP reductase